MTQYTRRIYQDKICLKLYHCLVEDNFSNQYLYEIIDEEIDSKSQDCEVTLQI
jgi:hypothetical protein